MYLFFGKTNLFSNVDRYNMVEKGLADLENVILHKANDYIISNATFPSYFIREKNEVLKIQAILDSKIFQVILQNH